MPEHKKSNNGLMNILQNALLGIPSFTYDQNWLSPDLWKEIYKSSKTGEMSYSTIDKMIDQVYKTNRPKYTKEDFDAGKPPPYKVQQRQDEINLLVGKPQKYGHLEKSISRPTIGVENSDVFYRYKNPDEFNQMYNSVKKHIPSMEKNKSYSVGSSEEKEAGDVDLAGRRHVGLDHYSFSKGSDALGKYAAIYDKWDLKQPAAKLFTTPWNYYVRRYYDINPVELNKNIRRTPNQFNASEAQQKKGNIPNANINFMELLRTKLGL